MRLIDKILNNITMYRLLVYGLGTLAMLSVFFAHFGKLHFESSSLLVSLALLLGSAYSVNWLYGRIWRVPTNSESWLITGLILFLILPPASSLIGAIALVLAGGISSLSKFVVNWRGKHVFNPAAVAAAILGLTALITPSWWIGSTVFWPFTLLFGLAVVRKIRRPAPVVTFVLVSLIMQAFLLITNHRDLMSGMQHALVASPLIFLSTIMLTEPATMPPRRNLQIIFAAIIAVLYVGAWKVGPVYMYPEVALLVGNIFAFMVSPKFRVRLRLQEIQRVSDRVYNYVFQPDRKFKFRPGQYMEWTLAGVPYDSRGNRRTFTIASSPTERTVQLGLKYHQPASMYKRTFARLRPGDVVYASQLAGNFTLPRKTSHKLAFIAGGIGITPFRSMIKYVTDTNKRYDIVLLYFVSDISELAYRREFTDAREHGVRFVPIVANGSGAQTPGVLSGKLNADLIARTVPDFAERLFYISGSNGMVDAAKDDLETLGVALRHIRTDHFSGY